MPITDGNSNTYRPKPTILQYNNYKTLLVISSAPTSQTILIGRNGSNTTKDGYKFSFYSIGTYLNLNLLNERVKTLMSTLNNVIV